MKASDIKEFGHPALRVTALPIPLAAVATPFVQTLITNMRSLLLTTHLGVAIAAPQLGESMALVVIAVRPTKHRPQVVPIDLVMINPRITQTFGYRTQRWEGCLSAGKSGLFAKTPRYKKVTVRYYDEKGKQHLHTFEGLLAQIAQHEIDHLHGTLFVDRVKDTATYRTKREYIKQLVGEKSETGGKNAGA